MGAEGPKQICLRVNDFTEVERHTAYNQKTGRDVTLDLDTNFLKAVRDLKLKGGESVAWLKFHVSTSFDPTKFFIIKGIDVQHFHTVRDLFTATAKAVNIEAAELTDFVPGFKNGHAGFRYPESVLRCALILCILELDEEGDVEKYGLIKDGSLEDYARWAVCDGHGSPARGPLTIEAYAKQFLKNCKERFRRSSVGAKPSVGGS
ncbi:unnamed protein product [Symbiodinium pilosum]|uniref:Uncharacterized protein n=1 Tax=Symbiodinium pilosum TaxID=2952 RepID=A0A812NVJ1_SYMPI|nr:unnamed protein product [Symbiodinium pilosum]